MSQFPRACLDSWPTSFFLGKQTLRTLHENSNKLPQNSCKPRMSQDFNRRPRSIRMAEGYALSRRGEVLTTVILIWFLRAPAAPAMRPAGKTVTPPSIHTSGSADHARAVRPGPRTAHVFCDSLGAVHFETPQFQIRKALGSLTQREADIIALLQSNCRLGIQVFF